MPAKRPARRSKDAASPRTKMPTDLAPMLATLVDAPFHEEGWIYEIKWDGYRAIAYCNNKNVELRSRNNKIFNEKFYPITSALQNWSINAVIDGEIVVLNEKGAADFSALQGWRSEADGSLAFYIFDLLWYDGMPMMDRPLQERRELLTTIIPSDYPVIRLSEHFDTEGQQLFQLVDEMGLEGIIAKRADSIYSPGERSRQWLKIKTEKRQEVIIAGYTRNEGSPKKFSALLLGWYEGKELVYIGSVGTGFSSKMQQELIKKMQPLETAKCPFKTVPDYNKPSRFRPNPPKATATWLKPVLVCEISFRELTKDGAIRHPSFKGLREDKTSKQVKRELPVATTAATAEKANHKKPKQKSDTLLKVPGTRERSTFLNPKESTQTREVNGHEMKFSNLTKVFWPKQGYTKRDLLNYYYRMAPYLLPYLRERPQTLLRHPHGIEGMSFYQKDVTGKVPGWIETTPYFSEADNRQKHFLVCNDEASLLYIASLGCIEINPWSSTRQRPDHPNWCIIDLDPDKNTFEQVIQAAQVTRKILESIGVNAYPKTSGSTGIHIYIPLGAKYTYEESKEFGRVIARLVHQELPAFTSIERKTSDRKGKMYIDFLQNRPQATVSAPYSLRPKPGATVSMPLHWDEVKKGLKMTDFHIANAADRVRETGDLFKPVLGKGIDLEKVLKKAATIFEW